MFRVFPQEPSPDGGHQPTWAPDSMVQGNSKIAICQVKASPQIPFRACSILSNLLGEGWKLNTKA